jgi:putative membrane-bound dehydrogenase-like protein
MKLWRSFGVGRCGWSLTTGVVLAMSSAGWTSAGGAPPTDNHIAPNGPLGASEAVKRITLPAGFNTTVFAAEPDVVQPIAMTIDPKGRLWVVENYSYPIWLGGPRGKDRILIFEDSDHDGRFDRRTVFYDQGTNFTGIELGFGGVWLCATPNLLFIPDRNGDDRPDAEPVVTLDGWDTKAQHNMFNGLKWGPDGWLWGCNGILSNSRVGKPGTTDHDRVAINCGVWRYHPTRAVFEAVAHGTTNPWGLDFDDMGEAFITNCVIPHLFHVVAGAHFQRMYGEDLAPNRYALLETCADHIHWAGGLWTDSREGKGKHGEAGGGHAHVGAMIYLGDNWPDLYRNNVFTCNIHGKRINRDRLELRGSTYVARHEPDFLMANDPWFRGLELKYGPDGAVYMTDWYDTGECHENDADNAHRENGRIYKISYGKAETVRVDLAGLDDEALAQLQLHHNDWYVRTARRLLQERAAAGQDLGKAHRLLRTILAGNADVTRRLRAAWALYASGGLDEKTTLAMLDQPSEHVRAWGVRLLCDAGAPTPAAVARFAEMARTDTSPKVRLSLASALQRLPLKERWSVAEPLASHKEDANDSMLPLMIWYGVEPLVPADQRRAVALASACEIPIVRRFVARRTVEADPSAGLAAVVSLLKPASDKACRDLLIGAHDALRGRERIARPDGWPDAFAGLLARPDLIVVEQALLLALDLDDPKAAPVLRAIVRDRETPLDMRLRALSALVERHVPGLVPELHGLVDDPTLRGPVLRALAAYDDPATPEIVLNHYPRYTESERGDAIATLAARPGWALVLLEAIERGRIPRRDLSVSIARQLLAFADPRVRPRLETVWGKIQPTSKTKAALIGKFKSALASTQDAPADPGRGRVVFNRTCLSCHKLFDAGGNVGPELTGSDRANPDYILENVLDPSAAVSRDYTVTNVATADGRLVSGIIREQTPTSLVVQTANERVVLPRDEVDAIKPSTTSMMPEGLLEPLSTREIRDLFAYLAAARQIPLPPDEKH